VMRESKGALRDRHAPFETEAEWLRRDENRELLVAAYLDEPRTEAVQRFRQSAEFQAVLDAARRAGISKGRVLEIGSGSGVAAAAWHSAGYDVTVVEPNPGHDAGSAAVKLLAGESGIDLRIIEGWAEALPLRNQVMGLVYFRASLHHTADLDLACNEAFRVLNPGGLLMATREHVVSSERDLPAFFRNHPTHWLTNCEMAYTVRRYLGCLQSAGFEVVSALGPLDSPINFGPLNPEEVALLPKKLAIRRLGPVAGALIGSTSLWRGLWRHRQLRAAGRLFSFVARRPGSGGCDAQRSGGNYGG
jgi:ubiquinone/menaquinone biosynthesis C-methylase UbiE